MKRLLYLLAITFIAVLVSCTSRHGVEEPKGENIPVATITFSLPTPGTVFSNGDTVTIKATAISTANIHGYDIAIHKAGDATSTHYFNHIHDHNDTLTINEKLKITIPQLPADLEATVTLVLDHDGHTKKGKVAFRVQ